MSLSSVFLDLFEFGSNMGRCNRRYLPQARRLEPRIFKLSRRIALIIQLARSGSLGTLLMRPVVTERPLAFFRHITSFRGDAPIR